jgi:hypothetical protein
MLPVYESSTVREQKFEFENANYHLLVHMKICPLFVAGTTMVNVEDKLLMSKTENNRRARIVS